MQQPRLTDPGAEEPGEVSPDQAARPGPGVFDPLCLYLGLAAVMLFPLFQAWPNDAVCGDWMFHLNGVLEARDALAEGQFPVRVAPNFRGGIRYGLFQFYGQFPYTVPAFLTAAGLDAWLALRLFLLLALALGGLFLCFCAHFLTRSRFPSLVAGACFVCAPYLLTAVHSRLAYTEAIALCLLPVVLFACLKALT